jgi:hypothetical protein
VAELELEHVPAWKQAPTLEQELRVVTAGYPVEGRLIVCGFDLLEWYEARRSAHYRPNGGPMVEGVALGGR